MLFTWLQKYFPRGLYFRAALILLLPIIVVQLVVVVAFSSRYFEDITRQLMVGLRGELQLYLYAVEHTPQSQITHEIETLNQLLDIDAQISIDAQPIDTKRGFEDFSSTIIEEELTKVLPTLEGVDFKSDPRHLSFSVMTSKGRMVFAVDRIRASASNPHQVLVLMVVTSIIMSIVALIYLRNQLRPIRRLSRAAEAFGRGEIIPYRLRGATEVRSAGAAFLNMRARIERQIEQRTLMLSGVSHDLRTPLTRLRLGLSMIEDDATRSEIDLMRRDIDEMNGLIDAFLDFSRADSREDTEIIDLKLFVRDAVTRAARGGGEVIVRDLPSEDVKIMARGDSLSRAIDNLISNALRYADCAEISVHLFGRAVVISVEDDGPGIPEDVREKAMQPFVRLDESRNQNRGSGVGLGLAIALDIARKHGGTLRLNTSERLGGLQVDLVIAR